MSFPDTHYHIRWSSLSMLDWQAFTTRAEAETAAIELVRENETYSIETASAGCKRCLEAVEQAMKRQAALDRARGKTQRTA